MGYFQSLAELKRDNYREPEDQRVSAADRMILLRNSCYGAAGALTVGAVINECVAHNTEGHIKSIFVSFTATLPIILAVDTSVRLDNMEL